MKYTIYFIENEVNHKGYVGMTSQALEQRFAKHQNAADNGVGFTLYHAMRKYGEDNFRIFAIEEADTRPGAFELEQEWIGHLDTFKGPGYNESPGGRGLPEGEESPASNLTEDEVREIRRWYAQETISQEDLGEEFGVGMSAIGFIVRRETWTHLDEEDYEYDGEANRGGDNAMTDLTEADVREIRRRFVEEEALTTADLAQEYPLCQSGVNAVVSGENWSYVEMPDGMEEALKEKGNRGGKRKVDGEDVREIRRRYAGEDISQSALAADYPISESYLGEIVRGKTRTDVGGPTANYNHTKHHSSLGADDVREIRRRYEEEDICQATLAEEYPVSSATISDIIRGETWTHIDGPTS